MARLREQMTRGERLRGFVFFALYFLVFPVGKMAVEWFLDQHFGWYLSEAMSAAVYYAILLALIFPVLGSYFPTALAIAKRLWRQNILAFCTGAVGGILLGTLARKIPLPVENPDWATWGEQFAYSPVATVAIVVIFMPFLNEVLFRGLLFGTLRRYSRPLAWVAGVGLFLLYSVWTFAVAAGDWRYLLLAIQYLPLALALTWCYDRGGSIFTAIALHSLLAAQTLAAVL